MRYRITARPRTQTKGTYAPTYQPPCSSLPMKELEIELGSYSNQRRLIEEEWRLTFEELYRLKKNNTLLKTDIKSYLRRTNKYHYGFHARDFQKAYDAACSYLNKTYFKEGGTESFEEKKFDEYLRLLTQNRRGFEKQKWIGRFNADFFLPWARNQKTIGLIIEICGGIYNDPIKQIKHESKCTFIEPELRIPIMNIEADKATYPLAQKIVSEQQNSRAIDSKTLKRLNLKIWIATLSAWFDGLPPEIFRDCFGLEVESLKTIRRMVIKRKQSARIQKLKDINKLSTSMSKSEDF